MKIPYSVPMIPVAFMDFAKGGFSQCYRNEEYGITISRTRETRDDPIQINITIDCLPDAVFSRITELREAVKDLPEKI